MLNASGRTRRPRGKLARRLILGYVGTLLAVLAVLGVVLDRSLEGALVQDLTRSLTTSATAVLRGLPEEQARLQPVVVALGSELGMRITVIRTDGVVVADSREDPARMQNHRERPEVGRALGGAVGVASRVSETVGEPFRYVALPPEGGLIVRVALPLSIVGERTHRVRAIIAAGFALGAVAGSAGAWVLARRLTRPLRRIGDAASAMAGDLARRVPVEGTRETALLAETLNHLAETLGARIESERRDRRTQEAILAAMTEGVLLVEAGGTVRFANPAAERLTAGLARAGASRSVRLSPPLTALVERARGSGSLEEEEIPGAQGSSVVRASAVPLADGGPVMLVVRDVTETRRIEAMRRDFVTAASHELKTPVAAIQATAETLLSAMDDDPKAARRFAGALLREAQRLARVVMDLLDLSRLEAERPVMEPVPLDRLASAEAERARERAEAAGLQLEERLEPVTVSGSRKDLVLLVSNLLDNAVRYTRSGGTVRLEVGERDGYGVLSVSDTGIGIASRELPRIFERFYRVDRARSRETGGTGLGLAIVKHVAEQHGGRVEAQSELGTGSVFTVSLPIRR